MNRTRADLMRPETTSLHQCKAPRPKGSQGIHVSKTSFSFPMSQEDTNNHRVEFGLLSPSCSFGRLGKQAMRPACVVFSAQRGPMCGKSIRGKCPFTMTPSMEGGNEGTKGDEAWSSSCALLGTKWITCRSPTQPGHCLKTNRWTVR